MQHRISKSVLSMVFISSDLRIFEKLPKASQGRRRSGNPPQCAASVRQWGICPKFGWHQPPPERGRRGAECWTLCVQSCAVLSALIPDSGSVAIGTRRTNKLVYKRRNM